MVLPIIVGILLTVGFGFGLFLAFGRNESKITTNRPIKAHGVERRMSTARTFAKARLQFERSMNSSRRTSLKAPNSLRRRLGEPLSSQSRSVWRRRPPSSR